MYYLKWDAPLPDILSFPIGINPEPNYILFDLYLPILYDNLDISLLRFSFLILRTKHHLFLDSLRLLPLANLVAHPSLSTYSTSHCGITIIHFPHSWGKSQKISISTLKEHSTT